MNSHRSIRCAAKLALVLAGTALAGSVFAAEAMPEILVEAAREAVVVARTPTGTPTEVVSLTRRVGYADLNLGTRSGAQELEKRVTETAQAACKQLDTLYPLTIKDSPACTKKATEAAMTQVRAAVAAAEKKAAAK